MKKNHSIVKSLFLILLFLYSLTSSAEVPVNEDDCPIIMSNFDDMVLLTREERIQLMDQALKDALSQVQDCRQTLSETQKQSSGNASDAGGSGSSNGTSTNTENNSDNANDSESDTAVENNSDNANDSESNAADEQNTQTATPSSELSGTEIPKQPEIPAASPADEQIDSQPSPTARPSSELSGTEVTEPKTAETIDKPSNEQPLDATTVKDDKETLSNGKLPEDIPPADNDDIIARQIRAAALAEPDPQKQARLWNEYRRYKGISEK